VHEWNEKDEPTLKELGVLDTTYGQVARFVIFGKETACNVGDWMTNDLGEILLK